MTSFPIRIIVLGLAWAIVGGCMAAPGGVYEEGDFSDLGKADAYTRRSGRKTAQARRVPWSGYYWSMIRGELVMGWEDGAGRQELTALGVDEFDNCIDSYEEECVALIDELAVDDGRALSPLMKFDLYVRRRLEDEFGPGEAPADHYSHASRWELDHHYIGDDEEHPKWEARGYAGKCIGWALSTFDWDEPTTDQVIGGILFRPADVKGILAAIYNGAQFFIPEDLVMGTEYHTAHLGDEDYDAEQAYADVEPHLFVQALYATIGEGRMLEADLDPGDGVWNYPIYRFELKWTRETRTSTVLEVEVKIFYANDEVGIDEVFSTDPERPDLLSRVLTFELHVPRSWDGDLTRARRGRWTGESIDNHPDALLLGIEEGWRETIEEYRGDPNMGLEVNFDLILPFGGEGGWDPMVDDLLAEYYSASARSEDP